MKVKLTNYCSCQANSECKHQTIFLSNFETWEIGERQFIQTMAFGAARRQWNIWQKHITSVLSNNLFWQCHSRTHTLVISHLYQLHRWRIRVNFLTKENHMCVLPLPAFRKSLSLPTIPSLWTNVTVSFGRWQESTNDVNDYKVLKIETITSFSL